MAVMTNCLAHVFSMFLPACVVILLCLTTTASFKDIPGVDTAKLKDEKVAPKPSPAPARKPEDYHPMHAGRELFITGNGKKRLHVFCYDGEAKTLITFFKTIELCLEIDGDDYHYYEGENSSAVKQEHEEASWLAFYPWRPKTFKLELYKQSCLGIETMKPFRMNLRARWVDFWRVVTLICAVILFFTAVRLARNVFFHYTTGITFGVLCSLLILVYILARLLPKKSSAAVVMIGGWGLMVYLVQHMWQNCVTVMKEHHAVALGYIVVVGMLSFAAVYRYGPLTDQRSINLVQWGMQLTALLAVFLCSQYREATLGIAIIMLSCYSVPNKWKARLRTFWVRRFPPKMRLLTEEEYIEQANVETSRALDDLREYCRSPKCEKWKIISKLQTPTRFAEFVEGGSHLDDEAILAYESDDLRQPRDEEDIEDLYLTEDSEGERVEEPDENGEMT